jgi:hypothetical protein
MEAGPHVIVHPDGVTEQVNLDRGTWWEPRIEGRHVIDSKQFLVQRYYRRVDPPSPPPQEPAADLEVW